MYTGNFNSMGSYPFKFFEQIKFPDFNYDAIFASCSKNIEAFSEAQRKVLEAATSIGELQANFTRNALEELGQFVKNSSKATTLEERMKCHQEAWKKGWENTMAHNRDVTEKWTKSHQDLSQHVNQTWNNAQSHMKSAAGSGSGKKN